MNLITLYWLASVLLKLISRKDRYVPRGHSSVVDCRDRAIGRDSGFLRFGKEKKTPKADSELSVTKISGHPGGWF
jgi:hypothetical protein